MISLELSFVFIEPVLELGETVLILIFILELWLTIGIQGRVLAKSRILFQRRVLIFLVAGLVPIFLSVPWVVPGYHDVRRVRGTLREVVQSAQSFCSNVGANAPGHWPVSFNFL